MKRYSREYVVVVTLLVLLLGVAIGFWLLPHTC